MDALGDATRRAVFEGLRTGPKAVGELEAREGGRFYEVASGVERSWGRVLVFDRPNRVVLEWPVNPANPATEIDVTFTPEHGGTRVQLVHRGWERFADPTETRASYDSE